MYEVFEALCKIRTSAFSFYRFSPVSPDVFAPTICYNYSVISLLPSSKRAGFFAIFPRPFSRTKIKGLSIKTAQDKKGKHEVSSLPAYELSHDVSALHFCPLFAVRDDL